VWEISLDQLPHSDKRLLNRILHERGPVSPDLVADGRADLECQFRPGRRVSTAQSFEIHAAEFPPTEG